MSSGTNQVRLSWLMAAGVAVLAAAGIYAGVELFRAVKRVKEFYAVEVRGLARAGELAFQIQEARRTVIYALTTSDPNLQVTYLNQTRAARDVSVAMIAELSASALDGPSRAALAKVVSERNAYIDIRDRIIAAFGLACAAMAW